ncbi:MAG: VanZ family protein [Clostridia bacterium]|nr:VanZ family protein [Clostridia bacterium]
MNRSKALVLFLTYAILLMLVITFGSEISLVIRGVITEVILDYEITDVKTTLDSGEPLTAGKIYKLNPKAVGKFSEAGGLRFASSNTTVLSVATDGTITTSVKFEGPETTADVIITSSQDKDFRKVISFNIKKEYPSDFSCYHYIKGYDLNKSQVYVGMTVYPYVLTRDGTYATREEFVVEYDEEYFRYDEESLGYVAIKETPADKTVYFKVSYPNGNSARSESFSIIPYVQVDSFDRVKILEKDAEEVILIRNNVFIPYLYKDGKTVQTKVDISFSDPDRVIMTRTGRYYFTKTGDYQITFTLPNGFSKTVTVKVRNKLFLPIPNDTVIADSKEITAYTNKVVNVPFLFDDTASFTDVTYEYDEEMLELTPYRRSFSLLGKKTGTTTIKLIIDDGYDRLEQEYTVDITKIVTEDRVVMESVTKFVAKVLGHLGLFGLLGILGYNYFRFLFIKKRLLRIALMLALGLPWAFASEFFQLFMEGRGANLLDVLIDICGYAIGALICFLLIKVSDKRAKKIFIWTAIDVSGQADGLTERAREVSERIAAENPALSLPMHISLKISCQIKTKKLPQAVERLSRKLEEIKSFELTPECIEREGGVVWIRHRESEQLRELHQWVVDFFLGQYGVMPHKFDLEFAYHTSLFVGNEEEATRAFALLKDEPLPERLTAEKYVIGVSESGKAGEYRVIKSAEFRVQSAEFKT